MKTTILVFFFLCSFLYAQEYDIQPGLKLDSSYRNSNENSYNNDHAENNQSAPYESDMNKIKTNKYSPVIYTTSTKNEQKEEFPKKSQKDTFRGPPEEEKKKRAFRSFRFKVRENQAPLPANEKPRTFKDMVERYQK